ncbi:glycoside hydrolase family 31 protein [Enterococcus sp. LJL90]
MENIQVLQPVLTERIKISPLPDEVWYGGCVMDGPKYPFSFEENYALKLKNLDTVNQFSPTFISSKGRALWSSQAFDFYTGETHYEIAPQTEVYFYEGGSCLKDAQQLIAQQVYALGTMPPKDFFAMPQWNSWIELIYDQNQKGILDYAKGILTHDLPAGLIMIDDLWADYYGNWQFSSKKFPNPKEMVTELHQLGFKVMLWVCPFISPDTAEFRYLREQDFLIKQRDGQPAIREWWNGYSAVLDLSHPGAYAWLKEQLQNLQTEIGIDGFKFDAGDPRFYRNDDLSYQGATALEQVELWGRFGLEFPFNEFRVTYKNQGAPLVNRLQDKEFEWGENGLAELIPDSLAQAMLGYHFSCPDMIGGGEFQSFLGKTQLDQELIVRSAQCSALMPMMQFSVAPWRVLDAEHLAICQAAAKLHVEFADYIIQLAQAAAKTGTPIIRPMIFEFPEADLRFSHTQFMLGPEILVAPVLEKGAVTKEIYLPKGQWQAGFNQQVFTGPAIETIPVELSTLPYFKKLKN